VRNDCDKVFNVNGNEMIISADLGSSSNYLNELLSNCCKIEYHIFYKILQKV